MKSSPLVVKTLLPYLFAAALGGRRREILEPRASPILVTALAACLLAYLHPQCTAAIVYEHPGVSEPGTVVKLATRFLPAPPARDRQGLPYPNYSFAPADLVADGLMASLRPAQWSYLIVSGHELLGCAGYDARRNQVTGFQGDEGITADFWRAIQEAKKLKATQARDYSVRRLSCASILFEALWLHSRAGDLIIPVGNSFKRWTTGKVYTVPEIEERLQRESRKRLEERARNPASRVFGN